MRRALLIFYCWVTNYRFRRCLSEGLKPYDQNVSIEQIRTKASSSITSVSTFLGFVVAVIVWLATQEFVNFSELLTAEEARHQLILYTALALFLPYSGFWLERYISAVSVEKNKDRVQKGKMRRWRSLLLILSLAASVFLFLGVPTRWPSTVFIRAFSLAGLIMTALSVVLLVFALEFYDSAAGWRGDVGLHFHLASIASNSYFLGVSLALIGASLCVCVSKYRTGRLLATSTLVLLITITEIERALWDLEKSE